MYNYFDKEWFKKHQSKLLWLLRFSLFRRILRIETDKPIIKIEPNSYTVFLEDNGETWKVQTDFRTHWKYSKRLYYAFKPLWYAFHVWDMIINPLVPQWNLGFDTLTKYPDPDPETSTVDGDVFQSYGLGSGVDWSSIVGAVGSGASSAGGGVDGVLFLSDNVSNKWRQLRRGVFLFDTSSLGSPASISAAVLSLRGTDKSDGLSASPTINIYSSAPASNTDLVAGDFDSLGSTEFATSVTYASWTTSGYNDFTLNASGIANIDKTGISKFGARNANYDVANVAPTWASTQLSYFSFDTAEGTGTTNDPKLVVTYSAAPPLTFSIANPQRQGVKIINN